MIQELLTVVGYKPVQTYTFIHMPVDIYANFLFYYIFERVLFDLCLNVLILVIGCKSDGKLVHVLGPRQDRFEKPAIRFASC